VEFDHSRDVIATGTTKDAGASVQQIATAEDKAREQVKTIVKYVRSPSGREERTETRVETHDQATTRTLALAQAKWESEAASRIQEITREHAKQVAAARPDWAATIFGSNTFAGGMVTRRIIGPVEAGAVVIVAPEKVYAGGALGIRW
jgi:hypothetical protein